MSHSRDTSLIFKGLGQMFRHERTVLGRSAQETFLALTGLHNSLPIRLKQAVQKALSVKLVDSLEHASQVDAITYELLQAGHELAGAMESLLEERLLAEAQRWGVFAVTVDRLYQHIKSTNANALMLRAAWETTDAAEPDLPTIATLKTFHQHFQKQSVSAECTSRTAFNIGTITALLDVLAVCRNIAVLPDMATQTNTKPTSELLKIVEQAIADTLDCSHETRLQHLNIFVQLTFNSLALVFAATFSKLRDEV